MIVRYERVTTDELEFRRAVPRHVEGWRVFYCADFVHDPDADVAWASVLAECSTEPRPFRWSVLTRQASGEWVLSEADTRYFTDIAEAAAAIESTIGSTVAEKPVAEPTGAVPAVLAG